MPPEIKIPGVALTDTSLILNKETRIAQLIWAQAGFGKTNLAGSLDALTQKYYGKRTLYIGVERSEGGGAATLRHLDIPLYIAKDLAELERTLGYIKLDKTIGGVVLDSGTECFKQHVKPVTLKYPSKENSATRVAGVMTRSDYQVAGELTSGLFGKLMSLTTAVDPDLRKHLVVTATDQTRYDDETDKVIWMGPDLPGRMSREAVQLFQVVSTIEVKTLVKEGKRTVQRFLVSGTDGIMSVKDRFNVLPQQILLRKGPEDEGEDLCTIWEKYWLPAIARAEGGQ